MTIMKRIINALPRVALVVATLVLSPDAMRADFCAPPTPTPNDTPPNPDNPPSCGNPVCETCNASPCFAKTGVYTTRVTDLEVPTNGVPLTVSRSYESSQVVDGALGYGWRSNFGARLYYATYLFASPSTFWKEAVLIMPDGESYRFREAADGSFTPPLGRRDTLVKAADGTFTLTIQQSNVRYSFDTDGALLSIKDDYDNALRFTLDSARRVARVDDDSGTGRYLVLTWNPSGRIASVQDNGGRIISYSYGADGTLAAATNPAGQSTIYTYQPRRFAPLLTRVRDHWNRVVTDITWNALDRVASYTEAGETYTMSYLPGDALNAPRSMKTHSKGSTTILYDANGLVTSRGGLTTTYNANGDILSEGNITYTYTTGGRIATVSYGTDVTFYYTYDTLYPSKIAKIEPRMSSSTSLYHGDWLGWKYTYYTPSDNVSGALAGQLKQVERMAFKHQSQTVLTDGDPVSIYAQYWYYPNGRVKRFWNRKDGDTFYYYDDASRTSSVVRAPNSVSRPTNYSFDALGRTTSITDSLGNVTFYEYDALDRLKKVTPPKPSASSAANFVTSFSYDNPGSNPSLTYVHVTDPNNRVTKQGYDAFGRLVESTDAAGGTTTYAYADGLLVSVTDANGNETTYSYDSSRRISKTTFPEGQSESYEYFIDGKLSAKTDRRGARTTYQYDAYGRMWRQATGSAQARVFTFEGQKLTLIADSYGETTDNTMYTYDPKTFLPLSERQGVGINTLRGTVDYTWGTNADLIESYKITDGETPADSQTVSYSYYADQSVKSLAWTRGPGIYRFTYNANGQPTKMTFPNDQTRNYTYDDQGRLTQVSNLLGSTNLATFDYEYDKDNDTGLLTVLGQRTKVTANVPALSTAKTKSEYFYDAKYQLTRARTTTTGTSEQSWTYDGIGNRLSQTSGSSTTTYAYVKNGTNQSNSARLATAGSTAVSHDLNGNMTAFGAITYTWDTLNRLKARSASGTTYAFTYDGQDRRAKIDNQSTKFIYQGRNLVAMSYQKNGGYYASNYLFGPGIDVPIARFDSTQATYYSVDGLGSAILLTDGAGVATNKYTYGAWGEKQATTEALVQPFRYTGRESLVMDASVNENLYYYRARYMMPGIGRFISEDPLRQLLLQAYSEGRARQLRQTPAYLYARNAPGSFTDPLGLEPYSPGNVGCVADCIDSHKTDIYKCLKSYTWGQLACITSFLTCEGVTAGGGTPGCLYLLAICESFIGAQWFDCKADAQMGYIKCLKGCCS